MFDARVISEIQAHAERDCPHEACGLVVDGSYLPRRNMADRREHGFRISPQSYVAAARRGLVQAVVHSHPNGPPHPTEADMRAQIESAVPWVIAVLNQGVASEVFWWGDGTPRPSLLGRKFRHGVTDCYALLRDYYAMVKNIALPEFPRRDQWWDDGGNLFEENFAEAGFKRLDGAGTLEAGDVVLGQIGGRVTNHCGVYLGRGLILHHLANRLSRREPIEPWKRYISHYLRYKP